MNWKVPAIAGALVILGALAFLQGGSADALPYRSDWGDALTEARETGKPILLVFGGDW